MKRIIAIGLVVLTASCSNNKSMVIDYGAANAENVQQSAPTIGYQALEQAHLCCDLLSEIDYQLITQPGKFDFTVTSQNEAFKFSTGKSFVKGIALPPADGIIKVAISSPIVSSVFVPTLLVLDEQYKPIQVYGEETINYDGGSLMNVDRFFGNIELPSVYQDGRKARYLLVLTTQEAMKGTTTLTPPDPKAAELGRESDIGKIYNDQPVPHTATGVFRLAFDFTPSRNLSAQNMMPETPRSSQKAEAMVSEMGVAAKAVSGAAVGSAIQPESELMYNHLIEKAAKKGELSKAVSFVEEAERAGSETARDTLIDAMKKAQEQTNKKAN